MTNTVRYLIVTILVTCSLSCKKDDALAGIDKDALFAPPTTEELGVMQADWQQRDLAPKDILVEETHTINDKLSLKIISFRLYGYKQYAGVLLPVTFKPLPVLFYVGGFDLEQPTVSSLHVKLNAADESFPLYT